MQSDSDPNENNTAHRATKDLQEQIMTKRRWLKSVIATSQEVQPALPFQRGNRRKPAAVKSAASPQPPQRTAAAR